MENWIPDVVNAEPEEQFIRIPNELIRSNKLTGTAVKLIGVLCSHKEGWKNWFRQVQKQMKEGERAIRAAEKELEEQGLLLKLRYRDNKTKKFVGSFKSCALDPNNHQKGQLRKIIAELNEKGYEVTDKRGNRLDINSEPHGKNPHGGLPRCGFPRCGNADIKKTIIKKTNFLENQTTGTPQPEKKSGRHQTGSQVVDVGQKKEELKNLKEKFSLPDQAVRRHKKQYQAGDIKKFNRFSVRSGHSNDGSSLRAAIELYDEGYIDDQFMLDFIDYEWQLWDFSRTNDTDSVKGMLVLECLYLAPTVTHFSLLSEEQKEKELRGGRKKPQGWTQEEIEAKLGRTLNALEISNFMNEDGSFDGEGLLRREGLTD